MGVSTGDEEGSQYRQRRRDAGQIPPKYLFEEASRKHTVLYLPKSYTTHISIGNFPWLVRSWTLEKSLLVPL